MNTRCYNKRWHALRNGAASFPAQAAEIDGKARRNLGKEILEGIREIKRGEHGRVSNPPSVASIRESTGLSQSRFAELLGVSVRTLQEWEQAAARRAAPRARCCSSRRSIRAPSGKWRN